MTRGPRDRGVSEVVAFVLVFAVIVTSVGVVYAGGSDALTEFREAEQGRSGELAFETLADTLGEIERDRASSRAADLELRDRPLAVEAGPSVNVSVAVDGGSVADPVASTDGALAYGPDASRVAYAQGAVFRDEGSGPWLVSPPGFRCSPAANRAVVSLVDLDGPDRSLSGGPVRVVASDAAPGDGRLSFPGSAEHRGYQGAVGNVTVEFDGARYAAAWEAHFEDADGWTWEDGAATCEFAETGTAYVRTTEIEVRFLR